MKTVMHYSATAVLQHRHAVEWEHNSNVCYLFRVDDRTNVHGHYGALIVEVIVCGTT